MVRGHSANLSLPSHPQPVTVSERHPYTGPIIASLQGILNLTSQILYFPQTLEPVVLVLVLLVPKGPPTGNGTHIPEKISSPIVLQSKG